MKFRSDFVTNSSSSSFIISCPITSKNKKDAKAILKETKITISLYDILHLDSYDYSGYTVINNFFDLNSFLAEKGWDDFGEDEWVKEKVDDMTRALNNGDIIIAKTVEQSDYALREIMNLVGNMPGFKLIANDD